jgi:hypothetical protein
MQCRNLSLAIVGVVVTGHALAHPAPTDIADQVRLQGYPFATGQ